MCRTRATRVVSRSTGTALRDARARARGRDRRARARDDPRDACSSVDAREGRGAMRATTKTTTRGTTAARASATVAGRRARTRWNARCEGTARARRERRACASSRERRDSAREGERCARWEGRRAPRARVRVVAGSEGEGAAVTAKKPRLPALDSIRFFDRVHRRRTLHRVRDEGDVDVGGAVAGERRRRRLLRAERIRRGVHDDRVGTLRGADEEVATESKVFHQSSDGIYPLYFVVNALFAPMFFYAVPFTTDRSRRLCTD